MAPGWNRRAAYLAGVVVWLAAMSTTGGQVQERPQNSTVIENEQEREVGDRDAEQDDATARLAWQRAAWGVVTPTFRASAIRQGKDPTVGDVRKWGPQSGEAPIVP